MAKNQTAGKGQRGNLWTSEPQTNLTASFLLSPEKLDISSQFSLTVITSLAVYDIIKTFCDKHISIKWPNDIMIGNKKVAGILIENKIVGPQVKHSIIGIGINVYQKQFPTEISSKTTSLVQENINLNITIIELAKKIQKKRAEYSDSLKENSELLLERYDRKLFRKDEVHSYIFEGNIVAGTILRVEKDGLLQMEIDKKLNKIDLKGITYLV